MLRLVGILWGILLLGGCKMVPSWLSEAPLIGIQVTDDKGRKLYLPTAPKRVALATPEAFPLWEKAGLAERVVAGCYGTGENTRIFFLRCDDSLSLTEALYRAQIDWVWVTHLSQISTFPESKVYVYHPTSPEAWLRHFRLLGEVYDSKAILHIADSLMQVLQFHKNQIQDARRFRVAVLSPELPGGVLTQSHPLVPLIEQAGGTVIYKAADNRPVALLPPDSLIQALPEVIILPENAQEAVNDLIRICPEVYNSPAVQYKRIFTVPEAMIRIPYADPLQTLYTLLYILHPEIAKASPNP
ncbi:MAG: hypothetical protein N3E49_00765 [Bacteroidia bacterium]|nr:hypothetical protein [Bacteroidia bacterium]